MVEIFINVLLLEWNNTHSAANAIKINRLNEKNCKINVSMYILNNFRFNLDM